MDWIARYNGAVDEKDGATAVAVDRNSNVLVTGHTTVVSDTTDFLTIKYNANGELAWLQSYDGPASEEDYATALVLDESGDAYVAGASVGVGTYFDIVTIKYSSEGSVLWEQRFNGPSNDWDAPSAIALDSLGNVYVAGLSYDTATGFDYVLIKYTESGSQLWVEGYNGCCKGSDVVTAMAVDPANNVCLTGRSVGATAKLHDYVTIKFSSSGTILWERRYNGPADEDDWPSALIVDDVGSVFVTGFSTDTSSAADVTTIKYSSTGTQLWAARYDGPGNDRDRGTALARSADGGLYVSGSSVQSDSSETLIVLKYSPTGVLQWSRPYPIAPHGWCEAVGLAPQPSGSTVAMGTILTSDSTYDYVVVVISPSGSVLASELYNGPANAKDVLTSSDAGATSIYIAGTSEGIGTSYDQAVVKYSITCACDCHADPACDGVTTILDVVETVNAAFRNDPADPDPNPLCPYETTDTDCNGFTDILDVVNEVEVAFRNADPAVKFCNPCPIATPGR